jgi:hypothetical protein
VSSPQPEPEELLLGQRSGINPAAIPLWTVPQAVAWITTKEPRLVAYATAVHNTTARLTTTDGSEIDQAGAASGVKNYLARHCCRCDAMGRHIRQAWAQKVGWAVPERSPGKPLDTVHHRRPIYGPPLQTVGAGMSG